MLPPRGGFDYGIPSSQQRIDTPPIEDHLEPSSVPQDRGWPHLSSSESGSPPMVNDREIEHSTPKAPARAVGLDEEVDPEGAGEYGYGEDEDDWTVSTRRDVSGGEGQYSRLPTESSGGSGDDEGHEGSKVGRSPQLGYSSLGLTQPGSGPGPGGVQDDPYAPRAPPYAPQAAQQRYDSNAVPESDPYAATSAPSAYSPNALGVNGVLASNAPAVPVAPASTSYDPYAPSSPQQRQIPASAPKPSPQKARPPIPAPFMPSSAPAPVPFAYAPAQSRSGPDPYSPLQPHASQSSYQPSSYDPVQAFVPPVQTNQYQPSAPLAIPSSDPYARTTSPQYGSELGSYQSQPSYFQAMHVDKADKGDTSYVPQQVLDQRPVSEDPLGRGSVQAKNIPLAVFGFGGAFITAFPALAEGEGSGGMGHSRAPSYGYASGRGRLWIRSIPDVVEASAIKAQSTTSFPGPLLYDSIPGTSKIVGAGDKKKKEAVLMYLENRAEEVERGLPYLRTSGAGAGARARREEEGKLVLLRLLAALIQEDVKDPTDGM